MWRRAMPAPPCRRRAASDLAVPHAQADRAVRVHLAGPKDAALADLQQVRADGCR